MLSLVNTVDDLYNGLKPIYEYDSSTDEIKRLEVDIFDVEQFVRKNECKEITNPILFLRENMPTPDGLLSNEIFGLTKKERSGIFAYIDLGEYFIDPSLCKALLRIDTKINHIIHGTKRYIINSRGELEENENGNTGLKWFKKEFQKIKFKTTDSRKRDIKLRYIDKGYQDQLMFIKKYIVIPPHYRDVNSGGRHAGVGGINKLYQSLLMSVKSLKETQDYGFDASDTICGRIQDLIVAIYDWFCGNNNAMIKEKDMGTGITGKYGILKKANLSKTSDYSSRLVLSAPNLRVERLEDFMVDLDHAALPLAAACADLYPYMIFNMRRFFENSLGSGELLVVDDETGNTERLKIKNWENQFSDEVLTHELHNFLHGYSNRFKPINVIIENDDGSTRTVRLKFKGYHVTPKDHMKQSESILNRDLTWLDVIYQAAVESSKDKHLLITRYPIDTRFNQFPVKMNISSTKATEPMMVENEYYQWYPKIRQEDIGKDTSNMFIDTMQVCNLVLSKIGGDY